MYAALLRDAGFPTELVSLFSTGCWGSSSGYMVQYKGSLTSSAFTSKSASASVLFFPRWLFAADPDSLPMPSIVQAGVTWGIKDEHAKKKKKRLTKKRAACATPDCPIFFTDIKSSVRLYSTSRQI